MKKNLKIVGSLVFLLSVFNGVAQTDEKPVLERYSSSSSQNKEVSNVVPELKRSSVDPVTTNKNSSGSSEQVVTPELKRYDAQPVKKEEPKKSN